MIQRNSPYSRVLIRGLERHLGVRHVLVLAFQQVSIGRTLSVKC
jgi:hypothetical protein